MSPDRIRGWGGHTAVGTLRRVLVFPPVKAATDAAWNDFGYQHPIDHERAVAEHERLREILRESGAEVITGEIDDPNLQDAIFPFDPVLITDAGAILLRMGKAARALEVELMEDTLRESGDSHHRTYRRARQRGRWQLPLAGSGDPRGRARLSNQ